MNFAELEQEIAARPLTRLDDERFITAHYYVEADYDIAEAAKKVASHQSTAAGVFAEDTLVNRCSARVDSVEYLEGKMVGLIALSFPLELFGSLIYSGDILHIVSGAVQHDEAQHKVFYLRDIEIPASVLESLPGPRYGPALFGELPGPRIGTIIKPCSGIDEHDYERIVSRLVEFEDLQFIKEDENLFPTFMHCPLEKRVKTAARVIERSGREVVFAPHVSANPRDFFRNLDLVAEAGLRAVMFSETYYGGLFRAARDYISERGLDLAIYGHNGGIGTKTRSINRVLLERLARLDGIDLRQTAPSGEGCYLTPLPWQRDIVERVLREGVAGKPATVCVRAGGLDQGNLLQNLHECTGNLGDYLFLMGSAINSIENHLGEYDPGIGVRAIRQVIDLYQRGVHMNDPADLYRLARREGLEDLAVSLTQRYSEAKLQVRV